MRNTQLAVGGDSGASGLFSPEALRRAWRVIRRNGATPGVDQVTIRQFERDLEGNLGSLRRELVGGMYEPRPVKRVLVPKRGGGMRPIAIWTLRDRVAQRAVHDYLVPIFEPRFLDCNYGFRPGRSVADAVGAVIAARDRGSRWVVDADIQDCFGSLQPARLLSQVKAWVSDPTIPTLIESWLGAEICNPAQGYGATAAASQGGVITPLLANLYLHGFDTQVARRVGTGALVRFADDFLILLRRRREAQRTLEASRRALHRLGLELSPHKTRLVHFDEGFKFLGVYFIGGEHYQL